MSTVTDRRGITYSAEAAGDRGTLRCHVIAQRLSRDGSVAYSVFVSNKTDAPAHAIAFVPDAPDQRQRTMVQTTIGAASDFSTTVTLERAPSGSIPEIHVALTGAEIRFTLAVPGSPGSGTAAVSSAGTTSLSAQQPGVAPRTHLPVVIFDTLAPPQRTPRSKSRTAVTHNRPARSPTSAPVAPIVLCFVVLSAIVASFACRPQIAQLSVPHTAAAGTAIAVAYRATGSGEAAYTMAGPDGHALAAGTTALGSGTFFLMLPPSSAAQTYLVRLRVSNPLGSAIAEDYVLGLPAAVSPPRARPRHVAPPPAPPQIRSLALDRATLASGDALNVYYDVKATSGTIALIDPASQITYGTAPIDASGHATFVAPHTDTARFLTVIVTAARGTATTQSRIGVNLTPLETASPPANLPASAGSAEVTGTDAAAGTEVSPTELSAPLAVHSLAPIHVAIRGATAGLQLVLLDDNGNEVARRTIAAGQTSAEFTAPAVPTARQFHFEATYAHGAGSETIVRAIAIIP